jgi:hypothetical protein
MTDRVGSVAASKRRVASILSSAGIRQDLMTFVRTDGGELPAQFHQLELASELDAEGFLSMGFVDTLVPKFEELMSSGNGKKRKLWSDKAPETLFSSLITEELGLQ